MLLDDAEVLEQNNTSLVRCFVRREIRRVTFFSLFKEPGAIFFPHFYLFIFSVCEIGSWGMIHI